MLLLSAWGYDVWGLDYSAAARELAVENQKEAEREGLYRAVDGLEKGNVEWVTGDFFGEEWVEGAGLNGKFDLIFDYTVRFSRVSMYACKTPANAPAVPLRPPPRSKTPMGQTHDRPPRTHRPPHLSRIPHR